CGGGGRGERDVSGSRGCAESACVACATPPPPGWGSGSCGARRVRAAHRASRTRAGGWGGGSVAGQARERPRDRSRGRRSQLSEGPACGVCAWGESEQILGGGARLVRHAQPQGSRHALTRARKTSRSRPGRAGERRGRWGGVAGVQQRGHRASPQLRTLSSAW
ncbi:hypothetical protein T484DRAFT_1899662, partial [Baffinella frigidus]